MNYDIDSIRAQFPALAITDKGAARIYFDNPAGTQVSTRVAEAHEVAVQPHHGRGADGQMEVARTTRDHVGDELGEIDHGHLP